MTTSSPGPRKKLVEVSIPLEAINAASAREKSIRYGHPSTLHLWWARRPLSAREAAIAALHGRLVTALAAGNPTPAIFRGETIPQRLPAGGLIVVRDGETVGETAILSPLAWAIEHRAEVEVTVTGATPAARADLLDTLLVDIAAAIIADRTLGGAAEWAQPGAPDFEDVEFEGAAAARAARVPVALFFTVAGSPLA